MCLETEHTLEIWTDIWSENSPGTETGIRQNIEVICDTLKSALESPSWTMKAQVQILHLYLYFTLLTCELFQAANAVSTVATKLGSTLESKHRNVLLQILITGLNGRTWNGKEKLLKALSSICSSCKYVFFRIFKTKLNLQYRRETADCLHNIKYILESQD